MSRHCQRSGCTSTASVLYGIVLGERLVWLEAGDVDGPHDAGVLCKRHADSLVVPRNWYLDDRRQPVPRLFKIEDEPEVSRQPRPRERRRVTEVEVPTLFDAPIDPEEPERDLPEPAPEMTVVVDTFVDDSTKEIVLVEPVEDVNEYVYEPLDDDELSLDDSKAHPWIPEFERETDLTQGLSSRNRLLERAFGFREESESFEFDEPAGE